MSAPIPRFKPYYLTPQDDGEYVRYSDYAALKAQVQTLNLLLEEISQISDQPFTETHEHLPEWIKTILQTRPAVAFREGVEAVDELSSLRAHSALATEPKP